MSRAWTKNRILDVAHKGTVSILMGLTAVGMGLLTLRAYRYFTVVRPIQKERLRMMKEEEMSTLQTEREAELIRQQKEAETMRS